MSPRDDKIHHIQAHVYKYFKHTYYTIILTILVNSWAITNGSSFSICVCILLSFTISYNIKTTKHNSTTSFIQFYALVEPHPV